MVTPRYFPPKELLRSAAMSRSRDDIARLFPEMVARFDPQKAEGINANVQFDLAGENGGLYWLKIADQQATLGEGRIENPKMTVRGAADDFAALAHGELNPMQAFMSGRIKIQGDMGLALRFMNMFNLG
nr:MAG: hypothetical protein DIU68_09000 [Chloroflexota bacterium]